MASGDCPFQLISLFLYAVLRRIGKRWGLLLLNETTLLSAAAAEVAYNDARTYRGA
jgi:hypothetical protein